MRAPFLVIVCWLALKLDAAVSAKQDFEALQIKTLLRPADEEATMDQITAQTERVLADTERHYAALVNVVRTAYLPVTYTLKILLE